MGSQPDFRSSHFAAQKHTAGLNDLNGGGRTQLRAGFQAFVPFPPSFLVQLLKVARPACPHMDITPGQQEDKRTG